MDSTDDSGLYGYGVVKLSNFTYSTRNTVTLIRRAHEDIEYLAPEVIGNKEFCGYKADTWSFGIVVFELLTGRYPFNQYVSKECLSMQIMKGNIQFPVNSPLPQDAIDLIRSMCQQDPNGRMGLEEIASNNWLNKLLNFS